MNRSQEASNAVDKTLAVIDFIFQGETTFTQIHQSLGLPKATLHRILCSLEAYDYVIRDAETEKYKLGRKFIYYGEQVKAQTSIVSVAKDAVEDLAKQVGESVALSALYQGLTLTLLSVQGDSSSLTSMLTPVSPLNCSASGKLHLARMSDEQLRAYFSSGEWRQKTVNTICTFEAFKPEQKKILKSGIAFDDEEYEYGLFCMSVPLRNHNGIIPCNIGLSAPKTRLFMKGADEVEAALRRCAETVSRQLAEIQYQPEYTGE